MAKVFPKRAIARFNISPVDFSMFVIFFNLVIALLVRVWSWRALSMVSVVGLVFSISVISCCKDSGKYIKAASIFTVIRGLCSNL